MAIRARSAAELGAAVRAARLLAGLSQAELALDAAVGRQWLVAFEAGDKASAPLDMVLRLLSVLNLEVMLEPAKPQRPERARVSVPKATELLDRYSKPSPQ